MFHSYGSSLSAFYSVHFGKMTSSRRTIEIQSYSLFHKYYVMTCDERHGIDVIDEAEKIFSLLLLGCFSTVVDAHTPRSKKILLL